MSNELVTTNKVNFERQALETISWLESLPAQIKAVLKDSPKQAVDVIKKIELLEIGAKKAKMSEVMKKAATTRLVLIREVGCYIKEIKPKNGDNSGWVKTMGLTLNESSIYQKFATLEDYHWNYVIGINDSVRGVLRECERYKEIKEIIDGTKLKDKDVKLQEFILSGLSPFMVDVTLKNKKAGKIVEDIDDAGDDVEWGGTHTGMENDDDVEVDDDSAEDAKPLDSSDIAILASNVKDISGYFGNFVTFMDSTVSLTAKDYSEIIKNIKILTTQMNALVASAKRLKDKVV